MIVQIGPANGPNSMVLVRKFQLDVTEVMERETRPVDALHQVHLPRLHDSFVDFLSASRHVFPVVKVLDAFMGFEGVVLATLHNVDSFRDRTDDIWRVIKGLPTSCEG